MTVHSLKIKHKFFLAVVQGIKTFEVRKNDRNFFKGDTLRLREYQYTRYTGRYIDVFVTYICEIPEVPDFVAMSIKLEGRVQEWDYPTSEDIENLRADFEDDQGGRYR